MSEKSSVAESVPTIDSVISLREITADSVLDFTRLSVAPEQKKFVADNATSIAQAHFQPETAWFRGIYADDTPVGFAMLYVDKAESTYFLWRFMIDQRYQRLGFGTRSLDLIADHVRSLPGASTLGTSYVPGEGSPGPFYHQFGFVDTGEEDDGEFVTALDLT
jgi:diamine N-acetyltransferase